MFAIHDLKHSKHIKHIVQQKPEKHQTGYIEKITCYPEGVVNVTHPAVCRQAAPL